MVDGEGEEDEGEFKNELDAEDDQGMGGGKKPRGKAKAKATAKAKAKAKAKVKEAAAKAKGKAASKAKAKAKAKVHAAKVESKGDGEEGDGKEGEPAPKKRARGATSATFARRYVPEVPSQALRFNAIKSVFMENLAPVLRRQSTFQDIWLGFLQFKMFPSSGKSCVHGHPVGNFKLDPWGPHGFTAAGSFLHPLHADVPRLGCDDLWWVQAHRWAAGWRIPAARWCPYPSLIIFWG